MFILNVSICIYFAVVYQERQKKAERNAIIVEHAKINGYRREQF